MTTMNNLQEAFAGESQANRKYLAFAKKAEVEKLPQIAKLFRAAAEAETIHAHAHLRVMGGVQETAKNLEAAIAGEGHEFHSMYPGFVAEAEKEGNKAALTSFNNAMAVEKVHFDLYTAAKNSLAAGKDLVSQPIYVCAICGNTVYGSAQEKCSVCGAPAKQFTEVK